MQKRTTIVGMEQQQQPGLQDYLRKQITRKVDKHNKPNNYVIDLLNDLQKHSSVPSQEKSPKNSVQKEKRVQSLGNNNRWDIKVINNLYAQEEVKATYEA